MSLLGFDTGHSLPSVGASAGSAHRWRLQRYYKQRQNTAAIWHYKARLRLRVVPRRYGDEKNYDVKNVNISSQPLLHFVLHLHW